MELEIAIPSPLGQTFTYYHPTPLDAGVRVKVPFAKQGKTIGVVLGSYPDQENSTRPYKLKPVAEVIDESPAYASPIMTLAKWLSSYYFHPIGEVLRTMLPASKSKSSKSLLNLVASAASASPQDEHAPQVYFGKKDSLSLATVRSKMKKKGLSTTDQNRLLKQWRTSGLVETLVTKDVNARSHDQSRSEVDPKAASDLRPLNKEQQVAADQIIAEGLKLKSSKPFLLFGVTGSGKTEVFLNVLRELILSDESSQALILVPEISLTPQMTRIFCERFPNLVAVVHSAMEDTARWAELNRIKSGDARILIGPRSAVFGPFQQLKLIIVDEEHDGSYKQGNGLLYNARDVAVKRAQIENATVVLGSATPSMESWLNAKSSKYHLLVLSQRVSNRPLPNVTTIEAKPGFKALNVLRTGDLSTVNDDTPFAPEMIEALKENLEKGQQSIVLVNRRGYAYYLYNLNDQKAAECPHCSISLSVHGKRKTLKCHYCDYQTTVQRVVDSAPNATWAAVGYGSQRAVDSLKDIFPAARITRIDSDTVADPRALPLAFSEFRSGNVDILVGTQILAKGHDFPNVTLICILEVDQLLGLPDFRGGEKTFQLLVQASGRAGRGELPGRVLVQSIRTKHPIVQEALRQDFSTFAEEELRFRQAFGYPPFGRMIMFEFNSSDSVKLNTWCNSLEAKLDGLLQKNPSMVPLVKILGPAPAAIEVIRGRSRRTLMVLSASHQITRKVSEWVLEEAATPPGDIRLKIDVDPQSTL